MSMNFGREQALLRQRLTAAGTEERAAELPVCASTEAEISAAGEEDLYRFEVKKEGLHIVETDGSTDVVMSLFGPNSITQLVAEDDDSGAGRNARVNAILQPGTYFARVRHFDPRRGGEYRIRVSAH